MSLMAKFSVKENLDVYAPRSAVTQLARELGFKKFEAAELAIVVSELCSNIVKYGVHGSLEVDGHVDAAHGIGIAIVAHDVGPAFRNLKMALQDGCDDDGPIDPGILLRRNGLGIGLGAVRRLTDTLSVEHGPDGKWIRVVRYLWRPPRKSSLPPRR